MDKKAALLIGCVTAAMLSTQLLAAIPRIQIVGPAYAQQKVDYKHTLNLAGGQRMLSQRMSKELLLIALGYNKRENLRNLRSSHEKFERVLRGLHFGDTDLALLAAEDKDVLDNLERVEEIWPLFETALTESMAGGKVSRDSVGLISDLSLPLLRAMEETVEAYEVAATTGALFSMIEIAIGHGGHLRTLSQKMTKEFLLVTYGESAEQNRERLKGSMEDFQKTLDGLVSGDPELRLIPAPTNELQAQLRAVRRTWQECKPLLDLAISGEQPNEDQLADMASLNLTLLNESDTAVKMYQAF